MEEDVNIVTRCGVSYHSPRDRYTDTMRSTVQPTTSPRMRRSRLNSRHDDLLLVPKEEDVNIVTHVIVLLEANDLKALSQTNTHTH